MRLGERPLAAGALRRCHRAAASGSSAETVAGVANPVSGDGSSGYDATAADGSGSVDDTPADDPAPDDATDAGADPNPDPPPDDTPPPDEGPPPDPTP